MNQPDPVTIGQRLRLARRSARLTQQAVAEQLGMARTTVVALENGDRATRADELVELAELYGVSVNVLLRSSPSLAQVSLQFRGRISSEGQAHLENECRLFAEDYLYLEQMSGISLERALPPEIGPGSEPVRAGRMAAEDERRRLGLGLEPIASMRALLEERLGVRVFQFSLSGASSVAAVYFFEEPAGPVVCLNAAQSWRRRRLSAAHELGHVIGSRHTPDVLDDVPGGSSRKSPAEIFSDTFQRHFLVPAGGIERFVTARKRERGGKFLPVDAVELADQFGVSFEALGRALEEDGLVKTGTTDYLLAKGFVPKYRPGAELVFTQDNSPAPLSPRFQRLAVSALLQRKISEGTMARLLRTDRIGARGIVLELAPEGELEPEEDSSAKVLGDVP
jgi:Zn-dependent peptidase ImmA (M78 family)/DNA-binding XRE family transcriptional regulator